MCDPREGADEDWYCVAWGAGLSVPCLRISKMRSGWALLLEAVVPRLQLPALATLDNPQAFRPMPIAENNV
jgi:hypothetical protein